MISLETIGTLGILKDDLKRSFSRDSYYLVVVFSQIYSNQALEDFTSKCLTQYSPEYNFSASRASSCR